MTKIIFISDLHGYLPTDLPKGDILCICGDIFPIYIQNDIKKCKEWLKNKFIPWTIELPYKDILLVAGNHDFYFQSMESIDPFIIFDGTKIIYLKDSWVRIKNIKFYGTPWCHRYGNWAFMIPDEQLEIKFNKIPEDVDFLLTHDAPYGASDICLQFAGQFSEKHIGSIPLRNAIIEKNPKYVIHGHLHSSDHCKNILENSKVYNASLLDENYKPVYLPLIINY